MDFSNENFTQKEWESCIKVLNALKNEPFFNPDNKTFSGLITKIHKNAKKQNRQENYYEMKSNDLVINSESVLMKKALVGVSDFYDDEKTATAVIKAIDMHILFIPDCALNVQTKTMKNVFYQPI